MGKFANNYQSGLKNARQRSHAAFTLVEMLAVMGIIATMLGMVLPAINDALGSKGRRGAVNILLNTFEQARVTALEQSTNVYVGFADKEFPGNAVAGAATHGFAYTRFIVFRDSNPETDGPNPPTYILLSKWLSLPKGISFKSGKATVADGASNGTVAIAKDKFPGISTDYNLPVIKFNNTGTIEMPTSTNLWLFIYEGFYSGGTPGADVFTRSRGHGETGGLFERISFARYTGRAQLDVTEI